MENDRKSTNGLFRNNIVQQNNSSASHNNSVVLLYLMISKKNKITRKLQLVLTCERLCPAHLPTHILLLSEPILSWAKPKSAAAAGRGVDLLVPSCGGVGTCRRPHTWAWRGLYHSVIAFTVAAVCTPEGGALLPECQGRWVARARSSCMATMV
jgi:hypothetical protein